MTETSSQESCIKPRETGSASGLHIRVPQPLDAYSPIKRHVIFYTSNVLAHFRVRPTPHFLGKHYLRMLVCLPRASRGIGLELVKQLLESPNNLVIAACRTPEKAGALNALKSSSKGSLHVIRLEVTDFDSVRAVPQAIAPILGEHGLDYLINNAGIVSAPQSLVFRSHFD